MGIIDEKLQKVLKEMSIDQLNILKKEIHKRELWSNVGDVNPLINSNDLSELIEEITGEKNSISDSERYLKKTLITIPMKTVLVLADRSEILMTGKEYASFFTNLSSKQLDNFLFNSLSTNINGDDKYNIDPKCGLNKLQKRRVLEILKAKALAKEMVSKIRKREFNKTKRKFEVLRNMPIKRYIDPKNELQDIVENIFGQRLSTDDLLITEIIDFSEAFNEKEKKLERGFFKKVLDFFKNKKQYNMPENTEEGIRKNSYRDSIKIDGAKMEQEKNNSKLAPKGRNKEKGPLR